MEEQSTGSSTNSQQAGSISRNSLLDTYLILTAVKFAVINFIFLRDLQQKKISSFCSVVTAEVFQASQ